MTTPTTCDPGRFLTCPDQPDTAADLRDCLSTVAEVGRRIALSGVPGVPWTKITHRAARLSLGADTRSRSVGLTQ